ncbi:MAG TPA: hypothetical protein VF813_08925, partial [Anaerolineaceae bacterium]
MRKECLARMVVILGVAAALAVPLAGYFWMNASRDETIDLQARMPENGGWSADYIPARAGQTIHLRITSEDVVHSFAIGQSDQPAVQLQPGQVVETALKFDKAGRYTFYCDTWC